MDYQQENPWNYYKLNYRGKFIRSLWCSPLCILAFVLPGFDGLMGMSRVMWFLLFLAVFAAQTLYNYALWQAAVKKDEPQE